MHEKKIQTALKRAKPRKICALEKEDGGLSIFDSPQFVARVGGEDHLGEAEDHEEATKYFDKGGVADAGVGEKNKADDGTDDTTDDPEESVGHVAKADKTDDDGGDAVEDGVAGEEGNMQSVVGRVGNDHGGTDGGLDDGYAERDAPVVLAGTPMDDVEYFDDGEADEDGTDDDDEVGDVFTGGEEGVPTGEHGDDALDSKDEPVTFDVFAFGFVGWF